MLIARPVNTINPAEITKFKTNNVLLELLFTNCTIIITSQIISEFYRGSQPCHAFSFTELSSYSIFVGIGRNSLI